MGSGEESQVHRYYVLLLVGLLAAAAFCRCGLAIQAKYQARS